MFTGEAQVEQDGAGLRVVLSSRPDEYRHAITGQRLYTTP